MPTEVWLWPACCSLLCQILKMLRNKQHRKITSSFSIRAWHAQLCYQNQQTTPSNVRSPTLCWPTRLLSFLLPLGSRRLLSAFGLLLRAASARLGCRPRLLGGRSAISAPLRLALAAGSGGLALRVCRHLSWLMCSRHTVGRWVLAGRACRELMLGQLGVAFCADVCMRPSTAVLGYNARSGQYLLARLQGEGLSGLSVRGF